MSPFRVFGFFLLCLKTGRSVSGARLSPSKYPKSQETHSRPKVVQLCLQLSTSGGGAAQAMFCLDTNAGDQRARKKRLLDARLKLGTNTSDDCPENLSGLTSGNRLANRTIVRRVCTT